MCCLRPGSLWITLFLVGGCSAPPPPGLILVTVDTLRVDSLGAYGDVLAETPKIDAIAARGVRFEQATTPLPRTTPALGSLLTGLSPSGHGSREVGQPLTGGVFLAQLLAGQGWETAAVSASRVAGHRQGLDQGFQQFVALHDKSADRVTRRALQLVDRADSNRPLFLWVHYTDPHFPYSPPDAAGVPLAPLCRALFDTENLPRAAVFSNRDGASAAALPECRALYRAEIRWVDQALGELMDGLEQRGRLAKSLIFFSADHGENQGEEGLYYEHGPNLDESSLRIPLLIAGPGVVPGVDRTLASLEDLYPTALSWFSIPAPATDGLDLSPRLRGQLGLEAERVIFAESGSALHAGMVSFVRSGRAGKQSCVSGPQLSLCGESGGELYLYDHLKDPDFTHHLGDSFAEERRELEEVWSRWPPETARQRAARTSDYKWVERPQAAGGWSGQLYCLTEAAGRCASEHPEEQARLSERLAAWSVALPPLVSSQDPELEDALRSLGYVE